MTLEDLGWSGFFAAHFALRQDELARLREKQRVKTLQKSFNRIKRDLGPSCDKVSRSRSR
jgi:hypothetical protein